MFPNTWSSFSGIASNRSPFCWLGYYSTDNFACSQKDRGNDINLMCQKILLQFYRFELPHYTCINHLHMDTKMQLSGGLL